MKKIFNFFSTRLTEKQKRILSLISTLITGVAAYSCITWLCNLWYELWPSTGLGRDDFTIHHLIGLSIVLLSYIAIYLTLLSIARLIFGKRTGRSARTIFNSFIAFGFYLIYPIVIGIFFMTFGVFIIIAFFTPIEIIQEVNFNSVIIMAFILAPATYLLYISPFFVAYSVIVGLLRELGWVKKAKSDINEFLVILRL